MSDQEKDFLVYKGNHIPKVIRLAWTLIAVFITWYIIVNVLPDLKIWWTRVK